MAEGVKFLRIFYDRGVTVEAFAFPLSVILCDHGSLWALGVPTVFLDFLNKSLEEFQTFSFVNLNFVLLRKCLEFDQCYRTCIIT